jgi:hypothetical protein
MKHEPYQGWTNAQTWCVALTLNNHSKTQDAAMSKVRDNLEWPRIAEVELRNYCGSIIGDIYDMAPWAWNDCQALSADVNWEEIREHFELKVREGERA